ncbi:MAG: HAD family hydrolase [Promethearchaeota archaeon]
MSDLTKILVIFDLDFTLIDNSFAICNAFNYALNFFNINPIANDIIIKKIGIPLKDMFLDYLNEENAEKGVLLFREYYSTHFFEGVKIIPGALELLIRLKESGYQLALLTSKKTKYALKLLEHIDLKKYFGFILGEEDYIKSKPDPAPIITARAHFPNVDKAFMVGDHIVDCLAAKNANVAFIGVLTGTTTKEEFKGCAGPNIAVLKSVKEIIPSKHLI